MFKIKKKKISLNNKPFIVAEFSGNHEQKLNIALKMVDVAARCGVDAIKLQTYTPDTMTIKSEKKDFVISDKKNIWKGQSYYKLFNKAYTKWEWHKKIFERAKKKKLIAFSSPFDETSLDFLDSLNVPAFKIASYENNDFNLIEKTIKKKKPIIVSTGMTDLKLIREISQLFKKNNFKNYMFLKCNSIYPSSLNNLNLKTIQDMRKKFNCEIGFSDHTIGISASLAAVGQGATLIEKHFTLNKKSSGSDAIFSIEPHELKTLATQSAEVWASLGKVKYGIAKGENPREKRSIYTVKDIKKGAIITRKNIKCLRPFLGIDAKYFKNILGKKVKKNLKKNSALKIKYLF